MTHLLTKAFNEVSNLPEERQDEVARWLLMEIQSDRDWDKSFESSLDLLSEMAAEALAEDDRGETRVLDLDRL